MDPSPGPGTAILESEYETAEGAVRVTDFMPRRSSHEPRLMRIVEGLRILTEIMHPDLFPRTMPREAWQRLDVGPVRR